MFFFISFAVGSLDHSKSDCLAMVVLSHGLKGFVYGVDDFVEIEDLLSPFKGDRCPSLVGKPKLFFIQVKNPKLNFASQSTLRFQKYNRTRLFESMFCRKFISFFSVCVKSSTKFPNCK